MDDSTAPTGIAQPFELEPPLPVVGRAEAAGPEVAPLTALLGLVALPDVAPLTTLLGLVAPDVVVDGEVTTLPPPWVPFVVDGDTKFVVPGETKTLPVVGGMITPGPGTMITPGTAVAVATWTIEVAVGGTDVAVAT